MDTFPFRMFSLPLVGTSGVITATPDSMPVFTFPSFPPLLRQTSGISDPRPIAILMESEGVSLHLIVTLVDAEWLPKILPHSVARRQLSMADLVLVNK